MCSVECCLVRYCIDSWLMYSGLIPRLIGELMTIWLVNILSHIINTHLVSADHQYSQVPCHWLLQRHSQHHWFLSPPSEWSERQRHCFLFRVCVCVCVCVCVRVCVCVSVHSRPVNRTSLKRLKLRSSNLTCMFPGTAWTWPIKNFSKSGRGLCHVTPKFLGVKC